ncbi:MAG: MFS transporter [Ammonifex sp.]|jgi:MFS family permease|nr:MAG: MFS transporter [Ammonifex sp.]
MAVEKGVFAPIAALYHRDYRLYWTGQLISVTGTWMQQVGLAWLVLELTHSALLLGVVGAANFGPILLFSLLGGTLADRVSKRRLIIFTQAGMMATALALGLLVLTGLVQYWQVVVCAFVLGTLNALDAPARQSFIIDLAGRDHLMNAIALHSSLFNGARVVGPAIAGVVIACWGIEACFLINAASFVAVLVQLLRIRAEGITKRTETEKSFWAETRAAFSYIRGNPTIFFPLLLLAQISLFAINFSVLVPAFARLTLGRGAQDFGFLLSAQGLGAMLGGLTLAWLSNSGPRRRFIIMGIIGLCGAQILLGCWPGYHRALWLLFIAGWGMVAFGGTVNTTVQLAASDEFRGRVMSLFVLFFMGTSPFGNFLSGVLADSFSIPVAFAVGSSVAILLATGTIYQWQRVEKRRGASVRAGQELTEGCG